MPKISMKFKGSGEGVFFSTVNLWSLGEHRELALLGPAEPQPKLNLVKSECQRSHLVARISLNFLIISEKSQTGMCGKA